MKIVKTTIALVTVLALLPLAMATYAQGPEGGGTPPVGAQDEVVEFSVTNTFGSDILYMFSGVVNSANPAIATSVHCTNYYTGTVKIEIGFYSSSGTGYITNPPLELLSTETKTISTQNTFYTEEPPPSSPLPDITQGAGVVRVTDPTDVKDVICTVQVVGVGASPETDPPAFIARLPLYDSNGNLVNPPDGGNGGPGGPVEIYLPIIFKAAN